MRSKANRPLRYLVPAIAIFGAVIGWSSPSDASVQKIVVDQTATVNFTPIILGTSTPGPLTSYTIYLGRIFGELDPNDPTHSIITDIDHAPKTRGKVSYIANFEIVTPTHPEQRSGLMIHQVPNRGNNAITTAALVQGATYMQSGWQGDLLAQCSPSPAISYPCFDLNSGPYGILEHHHRGLQSSTGTRCCGVAGLKTWRVMSFRSSGTNGDPPQEAIPSPVRSTATSAPVLTGAAWQSEVRLRARHSW